ncbi:MAG: hypothetical protein MAG795_00623 [Candidatus Woesearchaeota archaeon]|nr:hypothetical protein [Candidatus Woesearchaeota archaeon]
MKLVWIGLIIVVLVAGAFLIVPKFNNSKSVCPSKLGINYQVDAHLSPPLQDDEVFLVIINPDTKSYRAEIFIDGKKETNQKLKPKTNSIKSEIISDWYQKGFSKQNKESQIFNIDIKIKSCESQINTISPLVYTVNPKPSVKHATRFPIKITKTRSQHVKD